RDPRARPHLADGSSPAHLRPGMDSGATWRRPLRRILRDLHVTLRRPRNRHARGCAHGASGDRAARAPCSCGDAGRHPVGGSTVRRAARAGPSGSGMSASERLQAKVELAYPTLNAAAEPVWAGPDAARLYPLFLARLHGVATGAVPLMRRALDRCRELDDAASRALAPFLQHHIPEELGHDDWLLDYIAALGGDPDEVRRRLPSASAASANGAQLWWIEHAHPVALLGHAEVLECSPPAIEMLDE